MSKKHELYQRLMNLSLGFAVIFFFIFIINLVFAVANDAFSTDGGAFLIAEDQLFFRWSLFTSFTVLALSLLSVRIFYSLIHHKRKLMSATEYKLQQDLDARKQKQNESFSQSKTYQALKQVEEKVSQKQEAVVEDMNEEPKPKKTTKRKKEPREKIEVLSQEEVETKINDKKAKKDHSDKKQNEEANIVEESKTTSINKTQLIEIVSVSSELSKADVKQFIDKFTSIIADALQQNDEVKLFNFGSFKKVELDGINNDVEFTAYKAFLDLIDPESSSEI